SNVNNGVTDGLSPGTSTITANSGGTTDTVSLTVSSATLSSIEIYPPTLTMVSGSSQKFAATGIYSDNTTIDLTNQVTWSASDTGLLSVDNTYRNRGRATALRSGTAYLSASLPGSSIGASAVLTIMDLTLSSIEVTPKNPTLPANLDLQFKATGVFSNGSKQDLTDSVVWSSSAAGILKLNNAFQIRGRGRSLAAGTAAVTATLSSISGTSSVTVSSATLSSVQITPPGSNLPSGYRRHLTATGIYSDNSSFDLTSYASWQSSLAGIVMENIGPWQGLATATTSGSTPTITASFKGLDGTATAVSGTTTLTTTTATLSSIEVSPANPTCMSGLNIRFTATGIFSDATTLDMTSAVVWKTSDYLVTTASNAAGVNGQYHCVGSGTAIITAASGSANGTTTLIVATQGASMADTPE
ncbi:Ig-like domain-containing protein, partial [bacterium]|nr:Ig-like domain-containing protein [bacterium]